MAAKQHGEMRWEASRIRRVSGIAYDACFGCQEESFYVEKDGVKRTQEIETFCRWFEVKRWKKATRQDAKTQGGKFSKAG